MDALLKIAKKKPALSNAKKMLAGGAGLAALGAGYGAAKGHLTGEGALEGMARHLSGLNMGGAAEKAMGVSEAARSAAQGMSAEDAARKASGAAQKVKGLAQGVSGDHKLKSELLGMAPQGAGPGQSKKMLMDRISKGLPMSPRVTGDAISQMSGELGDPHPFHGTGPSPSLTDAMAKAKGAAGRAAEQAEKAKTFAEVGAKTKRRALKEITLPRRGRSAIKAMSDLENVSAFGD